MSAAPAVSVVVPVLDEAAHIDECLAAIDTQTYGSIVEVLVVDGGSTDDTVVKAGRHPKVRVLTNPRRIQAAAMNVALDEAAGDVIVRVDGHTVIAPDYVQCCVDALEATGAALVGGAMRPDVDAAGAPAIAAAMCSRLGAGPAAFHGDGPAAWVDTVYLGAFRRDVVRSAGGYREVPTNEDAELAIRLSPLGGVWFDPAIRSSYSPRSSYRGLARQFFRYGRGRAATVRRHPRSLAPRQLAAPALVLGLVSPWRSKVLVAYAAVVGAAAVEAGRRRLDVVPGFLVALPVMHICWGTGFLFGLVAAESGVA